MPDLRAFLAGGGEMGALIRAHDWDATELGPIHSWPQSLRSTLSICLRSAAPTAVVWGPQHLFVYNDAWAPFLSDRHPWALGRPVPEVMPDIWPLLEDEFRTVYTGAEAVNRIDAPMIRRLAGAVHESFWSYSLLPVASEDGTIGGLLAQARETTQDVLRARRDALMLRLSERLRTLSDPDELLVTALTLVGEELKAGRIGYAEVDEAAGRLDILRCLTRGTADISGNYPLDGVGAGVNAKLRAGDSVRFDNADEDPLIDTPELRETYRQADALAVLTVPVISGERYRAMLFAHDPQPRRWLDAEEEMLRDATAHIWREISRARAEAALRRSEERYRRIFEQANDLILTADLDQRITDCNPAAARAIGLTREQAIGRSIGEFLSSEGFAKSSDMLRRKLEHGGTTRYEIEVYTISGRTLHWEVDSTLTVDEAGRPVGLHAIGRDVTERRRADERQRLLVNELNHRVKNTLALVQGLALQSFREGRDSAEARTAFQERLTALAAAHDLLTRESWEGATLGHLVEEGLGHINAVRTRVRMKGPDVTLAPKAAVSLSMALHELATNAAKYGALSTPEGEVSLRWQAEDGCLCLEWRERGGPPVSPPGRRGFGLRMIERALAADLAGGVSVEFAPDGLVCRIEAALSHAEPRARNG